MLLKKKITPPIIPEIKQVDDTGNFDSVIIELNLMVAN